MKKELTVKGKTYNLPIFLPDATLGVIRSLDSIAAKPLETRGVVVNTYHLMSTPGTPLLNKTGGIKNFMSFDGLVVSDSGGWQVFSLPKKITDEGVVFRSGGGKNKLFTPEMSIQVQFEIGSDIIICLDDFTMPGVSTRKVEDSVRRTTLWAKKCKEEFQRQLERRGLTEETRPLLFAVIQGDRNYELREQSAKELIEIGFDGYGYGGYVVDEETGLDLKISEFIAGLIPDDKYKFALGIGKPWDIASLKEFGWDIFDCTLPTRDARHGRLYTLKESPENLDLRNKESYELLQITKTKFSEDLSPIENDCECFTCKNYTKAYLHHLFKVKETLAYRLATSHNLHFYNRITAL